MKHVKLLVNFALLMIFVGPSIGTLNPISVVFASNADDLMGVRVAIYDGGAGISNSPRETSAAALFWMFRWMNASVEMVNSSAIKQGILNDFHILAVPGGYAYDYFLDLGHNGASSIREFVAGGGAYWGSCAGAFYACGEFEWSENGETGNYSYGLDLFPGRAVGPIVGIADWPSFVMTDVEINTTNELIDLSQESSTHSIMYYGGPYFQNQELINATTLARYSYNDMSAIIAFLYENGRVFLTGPHLEWEEDSYRDGCAWDNQLDDNGSEWGLCKKISLWLVFDDKMSNDSKPDSNLIILVSIISIVAVIVLIERVRRK